MLFIFGPRLKLEGNYMQEETQIQSNFYGYTPCFIADGLKER